MVAVLIRPSWRLLCPLLSRFHYSNTCSRGCIENRRSAEMVCFKWPDYLECGGFDRALAKHAETLFTTLRSDAQGAFDFVMRQLNGFGNGAQGIRRTVLYHDIVA